MFREYSGIPWQAKLLIYISFIPNVAIGFIYTDLTFFLSDVQGLHAFLAGLTVTIMGTTLVVASIPLGIAADRYGRRKMLFLGNICASLSLIGFALTTNFAIIAVVAVLEGIGEAAYAVSVSALIAEKAGDEKRTAAFSLLAFLGWVAGAIGAFAVSSVLVLQNLGFGGASAHVALYIAVGVLSLTITPLIFKVGESSRNRATGGIIPRKSARVIAKFGVYSVLIAVGAGLFVPLMLVWFKAQYGVPDTISGPVMGFTNLLTAGVVFMSPRLARRFGLVKAVVVTQGSSIIFMVAVPISPTFAISASLYAVRVILMNLSNPLNQSLIMGLVTPDERGMASGIGASLWRLPNALSSSAGGAMIAEGYLALPFYIATVLYVVGIILLWVLFKDARLPEERPEPIHAPTQSSSLDGPETER